MIIDFRLRPPFGKFLDGWLYDKEYLQSLTRRFCSTVSEAAVEHSVDGCIKEMEKAGITYGVVPARTSFGMTNYDLEEFINQYPDKFLGLMGLDPLADKEMTENEINRFVVNGKCVGAVLEPGYNNPPTACDSKELWHIYDACQENNVPLLLAVGGLCYPTLRSFKPESVEIVAEQFPDLTIILSHGGFPWVQEICWVAYNRNNVYLAPDVYAMNGPGSVDYIEAANSLLYDKILFGSAYPVVNLVDAVDFYTDGRIKKENLDDVLYKNAVRALKLNN